MIISKDKVIEIFYLADNFCKEFDRTIAQYTSGNPAKKKPRMSNSEVITIMVIFHLGEFRNMKHFYTSYVQKHMIDEFPTIVL